MDEDFRLAAGIYIAEADAQEIMQRLPMVFNWNHLEKTGSTWKTYLIDIWGGFLKCCCLKVACAQQLIMAVGCEGYQDLIHDQGHVPLYDCCAGVSS
ncbi:hypothetical protein llap_1290 [Limosa lapponica baueri]|uniref:Uncharacterized protein n=1 Tax=Limosa lapponica baueri TaxID=1758121 RepID=A0A2I0UQQ3_LIMLA|nr:hypothetical protein llap_1290 [Limosa lapponica baueri]